MKVLCSFCRNWPVNIGEDICDQCIDEGRNQPGYKAPKKPRKLPKRLQVKSPLIVVDVDTDKIVGWFSNIAGAWKVGQKIEGVAKDHAKRTGHSVVVFRGVSYY